MDSQFNTLIQSYRDNSIDYELNGTQSSKTAADSAKQGLNNILLSLQGQTTTNQTILNDFYSSENQENINKLKYLAEQNRADLAKSNDELTTAKIRSESSGITDIQSPTYTKYYIAIGLMSAILIGLNIF